MAGCYGTAKLFGDRSTFVLANGGHIQTLLNPPGNPKAKYFTNSRIGGDPDRWYESATEHKGTWWDHWLEWLERRSGEKQPAPTALGSARYAPIEPAPGTYVHQRP